MARQNMAYRNLQIRLFSSKEYDQGWDKLIFVPFFVHYPAISKAKQ